MWRGQRCLGRTPVVFRRSVLPHGSVVCRRDRNRHDTFPESRRLWNRGQVVPVTEDPLGSGQDGERLGVKGEGVHRSNMTFSGSEVRTVKSLGARPDSLLGADEVTSGRRSSPLQTPGVNIRPRVCPPSLTTTSPHDCTCSVPTRPSAHTCAGDVVEAPVHEHTRPRPSIHTAPVGSLTFVGRYNINRTNSCTHKTHKMCTHTDVR